MEEILTSTARMLMDLKLSFIKIFEIYWTPLCLCRKRVSEQHFVKCNKDNALKKLER